MRQPQTLCFGARSACLRFHSRMVILYWSTEICFSNCSPALPLVCNASEITYELCMILRGRICCRDATSHACPSCGCCASMRRSLPTTSIRPEGAFASALQGSHRKCRPSRYDRRALQRSSNTAAINYEVGCETDEGQWRALSYDSSPMMPCGVYQDTNTSGMSRDASM